MDDAKLLSSFKMEKSKCSVPIILLLKSFASKYVIFRTFSACFSKGILTLFLTSLSCPDSNLDSNFFLNSFVSIPDDFIILMATP